MTGRKTVKFQMIIDAELDDRIRAWRRQQPALPSRNEAIRALVERALPQASPSQPEEQPEKPEC
jgi:hypothetical protein